MMMMMMMNLHHTIRRRPWTSFALGGGTMLVSAAAAAEAVSEMKENRQVGAYIVSRACFKLSLEILNDISTTNPCCAFSTFSNAF